MMIAAAFTFYAATIAHAAKHPGKKDTPTETPATLPSDPNQASLRVSATMLLYELDASAEQLRLMRTAAAGAASSRVRAAAQGASKLLKPMSQLQEAILSGADDGKIADLRNALVEAASNEDVEMDDPVRPTAAALAKSSTITHAFHATQLAAYLAVHADEVGDPVERMMSALTEAKDADRGDSGRETATEVAQLIVGNDTEKAKPVADKIDAWLKAHADLDEAALARDHVSLEASAAAAIGELSPVDVLGHWLDREMATLLSNPQLPEAIDALLASKRITG